jgi:DNA polymerase-1
MAVLPGEQWGDFKARNLRTWREEHPRPKPLHIPVINISSPAQIKQALQHMRPDLTIQDANKETLEELLGEIPEIQYLLDLRKSQKVITTYGKNLLEEKGTDGRWHFQYTQLVDTSRMAASRIQQIPGHGELGQKIRKCFVPAAGNKFIIGDFSQQEARIAADLSNCPRLLKLFEEGKDIYAETIRMMLSLPLSIDVKKEEYAPGVSYRALAKTIFFGLIYGLSPYGLSMRIGVSAEKAENLMKAFFSLYPETKKWLEEQAAFALKYLYIQTDGGWRRTFDPLPEIDWTREDRDERNKERGRAANRIRRQAGNTRIQGLAAAITKRSLVRLYEIKREEMKPVAVIHDELIVEAPEEYAEETREVLSDAMDYGSKYYLKRVFIPRTECIIADYWRKD